MSSLVCGTFDRNDLISLIWPSLLVCIDPLYVLHPRGAADGASASEEYAETPYDAASEERRAWGFPTDEEHTYFDGLEPAVASIRDFLAKQSKPFDGVLGFSQGAAIASLTACLVSAYCSAPRGVTLKGFISWRTLRGIPSFSWTVSPLNRR